MRVVVQRVRAAEVTVDGAPVGRIGRGLVLLVGLAVGDGPDDVAWMARKIAGLRLFDGDAGALEGSVVEVGGGVLAVSQFTLLADARKGRRPSLDGAMPAAEAAPLFDAFVARLREHVGVVATGRFGATMAVHLVNDGPFTIVVDAPRVGRATSLAGTKL
jgi:D-tyrosyl-tRNA(Tyr) deacylase